MKIIKFSDFMQKQNDVLVISEKEYQIYDTFKTLAWYIFVAILLMKFAPSALYLLGGGIARHAFLQF